jgi:hypothetical protein
MIMLLDYFFVQDVFKINQSDSIIIITIMRIIIIVKLELNGH